VEVTIHVDTCAAWSLTSLFLRGITHQLQNPESCVTFAGTYHSSIPKCQWFYLPPSNDSHRTLNGSTEWKTPRFVAWTVQTLLKHAPFHCLQNFIWYMIGVSIRKKLFISHSRAQCACAFKNRGFEQSQYCSNSSDTLARGNSNLCKCVLHVTSFFSVLVTLAKTWKVKQKCIKYVS